MWPKVPHSDWLTIHNSFALVSLVVTLTSLKSEIGKSLQFITPFPEAYQTKAHGRTTSCALLKVLMLTDRPTDKEANQLQVVDLQQMVTPQSRSSGQISKSRSFSVSRVSAFVVLHIDVSLNHVCVTRMSEETEGKMQKCRLTSQAATKDPEPRLPSRQVYGWAWPPVHFQNRVKCVHNFQSEPIFKIKKKWYV